MSKHLILVRPWAKEEENGIGFGQGSTAGLRNKYYRKSFLRERAPQSTLQQRNLFNLRACTLNESAKGSPFHGCCTAYGSHFDPAFDVRADCCNK